MPIKIIATFEDISNYELLKLYRNVIKSGDVDFALEIQEEIFMRMG